MKRLFINREVKYYGDSTHIKSWFNVSTNHFYLPDNLIHQLTTVEYTLDYVEVFIKLQNNTTLEDMTNYFFRDFLSKNDERVGRLICYCDEFGVTEDLRAMMREFRDFIAIMLQSVNKG